MNAYLFILLLIVMSFINIHTLKSKDVSKDLKSIHKNNDLIGLSVLIIKNGKIYYEFQEGYRDIEQNLKVDENTVFRIASISKTFCAVGVMQLVQNNLIDLDEDVSKYLGMLIRNPYFPDIKITIRQLLSHTSTIIESPLYYEFMFKTQNTLNGFDVPRIEDLVVQGGQYYSKNSFLLYVPGQYFEYSDFNYVILATVIESITGERFDIYMKKNILNPLNIQGSFNYNDLSQEQYNNMACLYDLDEGGKFYESKDCFQQKKPDFSQKEQGYIIGTNGGLFNPQGGLHLTLEELQQFMYIIYNDGQTQDKKSQILQKKYMEQIRTVQWMYNETNAEQSSFIQAYGLGLQISTDKKWVDQIFPGKKVYGHTGQAYGLMSNMFFDIKNGNGYIFAHNGMKQEVKFSKKSKFFKIEQDIMDLSYNVIYTEKYEVSFLVIFRVIIGIAAYLGIIVFGVYFFYSKKQQELKESKQKSDTLLRESENGKQELL